VENFGYRQDGFLSEMHAKFLVRSIFETLAVSGKVVQPHPIPYNVDDVYNEICDMLGLSDRSQISLASIESSKLGQNVVAILTDANAFYLYDNRESLIAQAHVKVPPQTI